MNLILKSKNNLTENNLYVPSLISLIAMKGAFITGLPMYQNPVEQDLNELDIQILFEGEPSKEKLIEFQESVSQMLSTYFKMSNEDVEITWKN